MIQSIGYVFQNVPDLPIALLRQLGAHWGVIVWGRDNAEKDVQGLVKHYSPLGTNALVCTSIPQVEAAQKWDVLPLWMNEPNEADQGDMEPEIYAACLDWMQRKGWKVAGPNVSSWLAKEWLSRCEQTGVVPKTRVMHGYGIDPRNLPTFYNNKPVIYTEVGPEKPILDEKLRAKWAYDLIQSGRTAAIYQAVDDGKGTGFITKEKTWVLNEAGTLLFQSLVAGIY